MKEILTVVGIALSSVLLLLSVISIPIYFLDKAVCYKAYSDYTPQYKILAGCRIDYNGKITPVDMIKNINLK